SREGEKGVDRGRVERVPSAARAAGVTLREPQALRCASRRQERQVEHIEPDELTPDQSKALERLLKVLKPGQAQGAQAAPAPVVSFENLLKEARVLFVEIDP